MYHVDLTSGPEYESALLTWLDPQEHERRQSMYPRPRREFTYCRASLRKILCDHLECHNRQLSFRTSGYGKPFALVDGHPAPVAFNVSHSGMHGLIAIGPNGNIGVDVEDCSRNRDHLDDYIRLIFAPGERAILDSVDADLKLKMFYRLWTLKEALTKATGMGLALDTTGFEIPSAMCLGVNRGVFSFPECPAKSWQLEVIGTGRCPAALAYQLSRQFQPQP